jgi:hypothetical protein
MCREDGKGCDGGRYVGDKSHGGGYCIDPFSCANGEHYTRTSRPHSSTLPLPTTFIGPESARSNTPSVDYLVDYANYMNNAIDFVGDLGKATTLLKKGFLWGKAINPDPRLDFILGSAGQIISDLDNTDITIGQRIGRAVIVGGESMITGVAADIAGAGGFIAGEIVAPEGGGIVGYGVASLATSVYIDEKVWNDYNQSQFINWGLGSYP